MPVRRTATFLAVSLLAGGAFVGCSSSGTEASSCEDLQTVAAEFRGLADVNIVKTGLDGLEAQTDKISDSLDALKKSSSEQFGSDIDALEASFGSLESTLSDAQSSGASIVDIADDVTGDLSQIADEWDTLMTAADAELGDCDLSAPSE